MAAKNLKIINPLEMANWDELISSHRDATIFHSSLWARVLSDSYRYRPHYFVDIDGSELKTLIPLMEVKSFLTGKRGVSLPFTDYSPPLLEEGSTLEDVFPQLTGFGEKAGWKNLELRGVKMGIPEAVSSEHFLTHTLPLSTDEKELRYGFRSSTLRNIKKANKEGIEVTRDDSLNGMMEFYRLNSMTRRDHGLPPQPFIFFRNLHKYIVEKGSGAIFMGSCRNEIVAAIICLHFGKKALYKYGASDKKFQATRANNLVMWEAIQHYSSIGCETFCFGRTEPNNKGLIQFKAGWGTDEDTISYIKYDLQKNIYVKQSALTTGWHNMIFSRMPLPALNMLGTLIYRHMG